MDRNYSNINFRAGLFHNPLQTKYSDETKKLIKVLMEEAKVTMAQRKMIQRALEKGQPLPSTLAHSPLKKQKLHSPATFPAVWKKRSQDMIINSGAYEREQYRSTTPLINKELQKRRLAYFMAYGKDMPPSPRETPYYLRIRRNEKKDDEYDAITDLVKGIEERIEFLDDMEDLGEGHRYRTIIQQEIAQKIRLIESLEEGSAPEVKREIEKYKMERPVPKPFPLGELDG